MEHEYFPPLEKCFSGETQLISWTDVSHRLLRGGPIQSDDPIHAFLFSDDARNALRNAIVGFAGPSTNAKSSFETKTAAINISPDSNGRYNLGEIKDDTLWLSRDAKLDQIAALRIVVQEWQQRPASKHKCCYSEAELASIKDAAGTDSYNVDSWAGSEAFSHNGEEVTLKFDAGDSRGSRLLVLYMDERRSLLLAAKQLSELDFFAEPRNMDTDPAVSQNAAPGRTTTIQDMAKSLMRLQRSDASEVPSDQYVLDCVAAVQRRLGNLENGSGWYQAEGGRADVENAWSKTNLQETGLITDMILMHKRSNRQISGVRSLLAWLKLAATYDFFAAFQPQSPEQGSLITVLRTSVSLVTLALFDISASLSCIAPTLERDVAETTDVDTSFYFFDHANIAEVHEILLNAAASCNVQASPAVFAWGKILYTIRELALATKEAREGHHVQRAIDQVAANDPHTGRRHSGSSAGSTQQSVYEEVMDSVRNVGIGEDPVDYLVKSAIDGSHVFDIVATLATDVYSNALNQGHWRGSILQDVVSAAIDPIGYCREILTAQLAILSTSRAADDVVRSRTDPWGDDMRVQFLNDEFLMANIFDNSLSRFPYEALPFLELCKTLGASPVFDSDGIQVITKRLKSIDTFTQAPMPSFSAYHTIREDENANLVNLDSALTMIGSGGQALTNISPANLKSSSLYQIPAGSTGQVISDTRPTVIMWYHEYSGLSFLGKWLELYQLGHDLAVVGRESSDVIASTIINVLTVSLRTVSDSGGQYVQQAHTSDTIQAIIDEASYGLDRNTDIVSVIFDIFEQELQGLIYAHTPDRSLDRILACLEFVIIMVDAAPSRVWPALARSSLLGTRGRDGALLGLIGSIEAITGEFAFLENIVILFKALVKNAVSYAVVRASSHSSGSSSMMKSTARETLSAPNHFMSQVLHAMCRSMLEVHESMQNWRFDSLVQKMRIDASISDTFCKVLMYAYAADDNTDVSKKLTGQVAAAAICIVDTLCTSSADDISSTRLLQILIAGLRIADGTIELNLARASIQQTKNTLKLCTDLIRIGALLGRDPISLESQLMNAFPILARLLLIDPSLDIIVLGLMQEVLSTTGNKEPSSLLGNLGSDSSLQFLSTLSILGQPGIDDRIFVATWRVLKSLVSDRQQWFAVLLLTGSSPQQSLKPSAGATETEFDSGIRGKSFLATALDTLSNIQNTRPPETLALLEFVITAQESWAWTTSNLHSHPHFFTAITNFVGSFGTGESDPLKQSYHNKIAALVADLSTVYLHHAKATRDASVIKNMIPTINWLSNNGVRVAGYNVSLHVNLRKNFTARYPCSLSNFKRTNMTTAEYGDGYFYDVPLATELLSFDQSWAGRDESRDDGFLSEFKRANLNMSLVDSQISLLHSFKALAIEHSAFFVQDREVQKTMARVVQSCLQANAQAYPTEQIFETLFQRRADFALALTQRLVRAKAKGSSLVSLLDTTWETMRYRNATYESAIVNDDLPYYRTLLTILLLSLQFHMDKRSKPAASRLDASSAVNVTDPSAPLVMDVVSTLVGQGFVTLTSVIHDHAQRHASSVADEKASTPGPKDFFLLLSVLETTLRLPCLPQIISQLSNAFSISGMVESCFLLYSWSHMLTRSQVSNKVAGNPIYADISVRFLASISSLPLVAEELAVEGVLSRLSTARMTQLLQSCSGVSPLDSRGVQYQALYYVWSTGILPLCANLLHSVGRPMAGEIAAFLNQFQAQLDKASAAFSYSSSFAQASGSDSGVICLASANEATTLALISHILTEYRAAGASAGVDALDIPELDGYDEHKKALVEDIAELIGRPATLKARLVATDAKEEAWLRDGRLEKDVLEQLRCVLMCLKGAEGEDS